MRYTIALSSQHPDSPQERNDTQAHCKHNCCWTPYGHSAAAPKTCRCHGTTDTQAGWASARQEEHRG